MIKISMIFFVQDGVVKDASCYLRNEQLNMPSFCDLFKECSAVVFISVMHMLIETSSYPLQPPNTSVDFVWWYRQVQH